MSTRYERLDRVAERLGRPRDELLHEAQEGRLRLCILGGGRPFVGVRVVDGDRPGEWSTAADHSPSNVFDPLIVPAVHLAEIEALGEATPRHFDASQGWLFVPHGGPLVVRASDLWVLAEDLEKLHGHAQSEAAQRPKSALELRLEVIRDELRKLGADPARPPTNKTGRPGAKAQLAQRLIGTKLFPGSSQFNKAWQALRNEVTKKTG